MSAKAELISLIVFYLFMKLPHISTNMLGKLAKSVFVQGLGFLLKVILIIAALIFSVNIAMEIGWD